MLFLANGRGGHNLLCFRRQALHFAEQLAILGECQLEFVSDLALVIQGLDEDNSGAYLVAAFLIEVWNAAKLDRAIGKKGVGRAHRPGVRPSVALARR